MADKKVKEEVKKAPKAEKPEVTEVEPHVVHHLDRRDSGTNWNVSDKLPSVND